ncbi:hypothetical protein Tco_0120777 [Tanacetum coccineum]
MYYPRFTKVIIHYFLTQDKTVSWRNKIRMHTSRDDYLINTLRFISTKEATQIYGATPPKKARKFKKPTSPQLTTVPVSSEEPTGKSNRVKRLAKKSTKAPARYVVIRETPEMPLSKKKEKTTLEKCKGIYLLSEVALTKEAQYEEARQKSLRDFHKTHPSGSTTITKTALSAAKIKPSVTNERTDDINNEQDSSGEDSDQENDSDDDKTQSDNENESDSEHETDENELGSESDQEENEEDIGDDEEKVKDEFVKTLSNDFDDEDEAKITNKAKGDEEIDYTTSQLYNDVDIRLNEPIDTYKGVTTLEKEVAELKKDPLHTQVTALVDDHLDARLGATRDEFMNYLSASITAWITEQVKIQLPQILPKEVSNFAPPEIQRMVTESLEQAILAKESSQPQFSYEVAATLIEFELKNILIDKMDKIKSYLAAPEHRECYEGLIKSYDLDKTLFSTYGKVYSLKKNQKDKDKDEDPSAGSDRGKSVQSEEPEFEVVDLDMPQEQEGNLGNDDDEPMKENTIQQGQTQSWLMTLASSAGKQSMTFDELMSTSIDFSAYIMNGLKITNLTQETLLGPAFRLLKGTRSNYAELERADNDLYIFKEGDFPRLRISDIEDMLLLVVQNRLTNLLGDDVSDFTIALRMFTRSLVIQKRVEDFQLGVESFQKKINVTKPETTKFGIRKRDPYTPYQDP